MFLVLAARSVYNYTCVAEAAQMCVRTAPCRMQSLVLRVRWLAPKWPFPLALDKYPPIRFRHADPTTHKLLYERRRVRFCIAFLVLLGPCAFWNACQFFLFVLFNQVLQQSLFLFPMPDALSVGVPRAPFNRAMDLRQPFPTCQICETRFVR